MQGFFYDFEVLKNAFTATFIKVDTANKYIEDYIKASIFITSNYFTEDNNMIYGSYEVNHVIEQINTDATIKKIVECLLTIE